MRDSIDEIIIPNERAKFAVKYINYENRYDITDFESKLCYEQGKYMENVIWAGEQINRIPEIEIPYCTLK